MKNVTFKLLSATVLAGALATSAQAQFTFPAGEIDGMGASSIQNVLSNIHACFGQNNPYGDNKGNITTPFFEDFSSGAVLDCSGTTTAATTDNDIYNAGATYNGQYIATGSGLGRQEWRLFSNQFTGTNVFPANKGPFPATPWTNVQYAFSDAAATASDITAYNTSAAPSAGKAIQFPLFVLPVAVAYAPVYGYKGTTELAFNITKAQKVNKETAGGLKLSTQNYCDIFNGVVTNWNDGSLEENKNGHSLRASADDVTRWNTVGVPIRLVGRVDKSGTTDLFSHALSNQCAGKAGNKFLRAQESLPYASTGSSVSYTALRSDTNYKPSVAQTSFAGDVNTLSDVVWDKTNFCLIGQVNASVCNTSTISASSWDFGQYIVADGSGGVEGAILAKGANALLDGTGGVTLNGKVGYISADVVAPAHNKTLFSAALQQTPNSAITTKTKFLMPTSKNGVTALGKVLPPQTKAGSGKFDTTDPRSVYKDITNKGAGEEAVSRSNPLHWVNVLYPNPASGQASLENPATGYPITGTTNMLTYQCFSDGGKLAAITNLVNGMLAAGLTAATDAKFDKRANGSTLDVKTFSGTSGTAIGVLTKSNIGVMPKAWAHAIQQTFFLNSAENKSGTVLGNQNLWMRDASGTASPTCAGKVGA